MARFFLPNPRFELGDRDWTKTAPWTIVEDAAAARSGRWVAKLTTTSNDIELKSTEFDCRPGAIINVSAWLDSSAISAAGPLGVRVRWIDKDGATIAVTTIDDIGVANPYTQSSILGTAPDRTKRFSVEAVGGGMAGGPLVVDDFDALGHVIERIPASAIIREHRVLEADTVGRFDPLVGSDKFSEFNAGMSDHWSGVYNFVPALPGEDLGELVAFVRRLRKTDRFFAFDPDRVVPVNGVVPGMVVDGGANGGNTRIPIRGGPVNTTALLADDHVEIGAQYFCLLRDLEIGPEGTGEMIVWPAVRASLTDGEDVITDHPAMVARITSDLDKRRLEAHPVGPIAVSWEEVV